MRKYICLILIFAFLTFFAREAKARDNDLASVAFIGYTLLTIFDVFSAPHSAKKYNDTIFLNISPPPKKNKADFGQPRFSRQALVKTQESMHLPGKQHQATAKRKSPTGALLWSVGATALPIVIATELSNGSEGVSGFMIGFGLIAGPSAGHVYAGQWQRGVATSLLRLISAVLFLNNFEWFTD